MDFENNKIADVETLTETTAAQVLGVAKITLQRLRKRGEISHFRIGARVLYSTEHLKDFLNRVERKSDSEQRGNSG
jgi:excisionase family DNA binding protein